MQVKNTDNVMADMDTCHLDKTRKEIKDKD